jgi:hypothetical protein
MKNIYLDDDKHNRPTPHGFIRTYSVEQLIQKLDMYKTIDTISLDNDLGSKLDGIDFVKIWINKCIENNCSWTIKNVIIHSANPIAVKNMYSLLNQAKKHHLIDANITEKSKLFKNER